MTINCRGRVNVTVPGAPVRLATDPSIRACRLFFQVIPGLTGKMYIGASSMDKTSFSGCARILWPNSAGGFSESFSVESQDGENSLCLSDYAIDADVACEGLLVTYWVE